MREAEHKNHNAHEEGREGSEKPNDHDSRFKQMPERYCSFVDYPETKIPKLNHPDAHVQAKQVETFLVRITDAGLSPNAVMVHLVLAHPTSTAVVNPRKLEVLTHRASLSGRTVLVVIKFLCLSLH